MGGQVRQRAVEGRDGEPVGGREGEEAPRSAVCRLFRSDRGWGHNSTHFTPLPPHWQVGDAYIVLGGVDRNTGIVLVPATAELRTRYILERVFALAHALQVRQRWTMGGEGRGRGHALQAPSNSDRIPLRGRRCRLRLAACATSSGCPSTRAWGCTSGTSSRASSARGAPASVRLGMGGKPGRVTAPRSCALRIKSEGDIAFAQLALALSPLQVFSDPLYWQRSEQRLRATQMDSPARPRRRAPISPRRTASLQKARAARPPQARITTCCPSIESPLKWTTLTQRVMTQRVKACNRALHRRHGRKRVGYTD